LPPRGDENWRNRDKRVPLVRIKSRARKGIQIGFCRRYHTVRNAYRRAILVRDGFKSAERDALENTSLQDNAVGVALAQDNESA